MQYQISYLSPRRYAQELAEEFLELLPKDTILQRLDREPSTSADVHLVGFEFGGTDLNAIPLDVIDFLDKLDNKVIFLFAAVPFQIDETITRSGHNKVIPFLPRDCDYRGLHLFPCHPPEGLLRELRQVCQEQPENTRAKLWLSRCEKAVNKPGNRETQKACQFVRHVLDLDNDL